MTLRTATTLLILLTAGLVLALAMLGPTRPGKEATGQALERDPPLAAVAAVLARMAVKEALAADLVAGRATLAEVTARFLAMNGPERGYMVSIRRRHPGRSDEESHARNVIAYALGQVEAPAERCRVRSRLEAEFGALFPPDPAAARTTREDPHPPGPGQ